VVYVHLAKIAIPRSAQYDIHIVRDRADSILRWYWVYYLTIFTRFKPAHPYYRSSGADKSVHRKVVVLYFVQA